MDSVENKLEHLWGKVGFIIHLSQMIEYTLSNILAFNEILYEFNNRESMYAFEFNEFAKRASDLYEELSKKPLGFGLEKAKKAGYFNKSQNWLEKICKERNFVVHKLFRQDLIDKHLDTNPEFYYERLENLIEEMNDINNDLNEIFAWQKNTYKSIFQQ